jgi:hypothetical protein
MTLTARDRYILIGVVILGVLGAYWFLALSPKRAKLSALDKDLAEAQQTLTQAQQEKVTFAQAQVQFPNLYASLGRLGKAVPASRDVPSLLVQLNDAAGKANVDFRSIELKLDLADKLPAPGSPTSTAEGGAAAPATGPTGATGAAGSTGTTGAAGATTPPGVGTSIAATGTGTGAATGSLQPLPFEYKFKGNFFKLENLIHNVTRLVNSRNRQLAISGRLVVIQGFALKRTSVTIVATTYMLPADQGLFAGATAAGPAGTTSATPQPASSAPGQTTPPTALVTAK